MLKMRKIIIGMAAFGALATTTIAISSCSHSTLSKINKDAGYMFGGEGIFVHHDSDVNSWSTEKNIPSGNYIVAVGNSGSTDTWKMLFDNSANSSMPSNGYTYSVLKPPPKANKIGGALTRFLLSTKPGNADNYSKWLSKNHIGVLLVEYKASKNNDVASGSKAKYATKFSDVVKYLKADESGSIAFIKGSSVVASNKKKHIDPSKAQFDFSNPANNNYQNLMEQLHNIYGVSTK